MANGRFLILKIVWKLRKFFITLFDKNLMKATFLLIKKSLNSSFHKIFFRWAFFDKNYVNLTIPSLLLYKIFDRNSFCEIKELQFFSAISAKDLVLGRRIFHSAIAENHCRQFFVNLTNFFSFSKEFPSVKQTALSKVQWVQNWFHEIF